MKFRLNKYLATSGIASRRKSERYIKDGRVRVNGEVITNLSTYVDDQSDTISFDEKDLTLKTKKIYIALNKPQGYICSEDDPHDRLEASSLLPQTEARLFNVGRLDMDTEGLICFTNDGELAHRMTHPKYELPKTYIVTLDHPLTESLRQRILDQKVSLEDGPTPKCNLATEDSQCKIWTITLFEGRNRIVRRIFETLGYAIIHLKRISIGPIQLGRLKVKETRYLTLSELKILRKKLL